MGSEAHCGPHIAHSRCPHDAVNTAGTRAMEHSDTQRRHHVQTAGTATLERPRALPGQQGGARCKFFVPPQTFLTALWSRDQLPTVLHACDDTKLSAIRCARTHQADTYRGDVRAQQTTRDERQRGREDGGIYLIFRQRPLRHAMLHSSARVKTTCSQSLTTLRQASGSSHSQNLGLVGVADGDVVLTERGPFQGDDLG